MHLARSSLTGIVYMVLANGSITINNALIKLVVVELPPMQAMFLRAIAAVLLGLPVLAATSSLASLRHVVAPRVLARSMVECGAAIAFVLAIATAPLADLTAILQLTPMLVLLGAMLFFGDKVPRIAVGLVVLAMVGAVLVAQPGAHGLQPYVLSGCSVPHSAPGATCWADGWRSRFRGWRWPLAFRPCRSWSSARRRWCLSIG
jgi:drug/metabolite transporter (DMT)-like permease